MLLAALAVFFSLYTKTFVWVALRDIGDIDAQKNRLLNSVLDSLQVAKGWVRLHLDSDCHRSILSDATVSQTVRFFRRSQRGRGQGSTSSLESNKRDLQSLVGTRQRKK